MSEPTSGPDRFRWRRDGIAWVISRIRSFVRRHLDAAPRPDEDSHGTTCLDCGQAIDDSRPYSPTDEGELMHNDCGDPDENGDTT